MNIYIILILLVSSVYSEPITIYPTQLVRDISNSSDNSPRFVIENEIEMPECSEMNEAACHNDDHCEWIENIEQGICDILNASECLEIENTTGECWWYGGTYYGPYCYGSYYEIDNSYCEQIPYILGDLNNDLLINVLDIIETVHLILNDEFNFLVDMNYDQQVNVLDVIQLVNIILNR